MFPSAASVGAQSPQPCALRITVESQVMALVGPGTAGLPRAAAPGSRVRTSAPRAPQRLAPGLPVDSLFERILRPSVPRAGRAEPAPPACLAWPRGYAPRLRPAMSVGKPFGEVSGRQNAGTVAAGCVPPAACPAGTPAAVQKLTAARALVG